MIWIQFCTSFKSTIFRTPFNLACACVPNQVAGPSAVKTGEWRPLTANESHRNNNEFSIENDHMLCFIMFVNKRRPRSFSVAEKGVTNVDINWKRLHSKEKNKKIVFTRGKLTLSSATWNCVWRWAKLNNNHNMFKHLARHLKQTPPKKKKKQQQITPYS